MTDDIARSVAHIAAAAGSRRPAIALVLGSGWQGVAACVQNSVDIAYRDLPAFPVVGVAGHAGTLRLGTIAGVEVAANASSKVVASSMRPDCASSVAVSTTAAPSGARPFNRASAERASASAAGPRPAAASTVAFNIWAVTMRGTGAS